MTVPAGPTSSNSVVAIAAPNWTDPIPIRTRTVGGTASARRLVLVLERNVLERVHLAEVRAAGLERGAYLGVGQLRAALGAGLLDDGVDSACLFQVWHQSCCFVSTWVTGRPVARSALDGRSSLSHFEARCGSVAMTISSKLPKLAASWTAAIGSESPIEPSTLKPSLRIR